MEYKSAHEPMPLVMAKSAVGLEKRC